MRMHLTLLRVALALLLVGSAVLFFVGSTIERHNRHETAAVQPAPSHSAGETSEADESGGESETSHPDSSEGSSNHVESGHTEAGATILGINTESLALSIVAVVVSVLLAGAVLLGRPLKLVLLAAIVFGLAFAAGDGRELVHQLDESNHGLATIAAILLALHLAIAALAARVLWSGPTAGFSAAEAA